jgi:hypothetical protein
MTRCDFGNVSQARRALRQTGSLSATLAPADSRHDLRGQEELRPPLPGPGLTLARRGGVASHLLCNACARVRAGSRRDRVADGQLDYQALVDKLLGEGEAVIATG